MVGKTPTELGAKYLLIFNNEDAAVWCRWGSRWRFFRHRDPRDLPLRVCRVQVFCLCLALTRIYLTVSQL
ncbi:MAG: hypothetical protein H6Q86_1143 [candidate division NC10 bacterium]|nr:hypothetical protein [candidate division NC10 bacterium]